MTDKYAAKRPDLPRECFRKDRMPKKPYTRRRARGKALERPGYHAYRCGTCGHWHVGRGRDRRPRREAS